MTSGHYINYVAFVLVCLILMSLPFLPALQEWLHPSDAEALPISPNYSSEIDHFAKRLQADAAARLGQGPSTGYENFDFVSLPLENMDWLKAPHRLISKESLVTPAPVRTSQALYVEGSVHVGAESSFTALYATGDMELGEQSEIHDWAHAGGTLRMGRKSLALRRVSAGTAIELKEDAWFERLQAPVLRFGASSALHARESSVDVREPANFADLPGAIRQTPSLFLIRGDCTLEADKIYQGSLVVTGFLTVGERTVVNGDIKAREGLSLGEGSSMQGAITCEKRIYIFTNARVVGPVISEGDVLIGSGALVGLPEANTSISARNILVEVGAVVHGAVWAHEVGMVKSA